MQRYLRGQIWKFEDPYEKFRFTSVTSVQRGSRPVIVVSNDLGNATSPTVIVVPCTTQAKTKLPTHYEFKINDLNNTALCEQVMTVDKTSLVSYITTLSAAEMEEVSRCVEIAVSCFETRCALGGTVTGSSSISSSKPDFHVVPSKYRTMRTREQKRAVVSAYAAAKHDPKALKELCVREHFTSVRMLKQSVVRWSTLN